MTPPEPISREEMFEMAALEVFGLLDDYESSLFTRSFHYAPVRLQEEIIELQADLVSDESLLPKGDPDPTLRERVLRALKEEMKLDASRFSPLATFPHARNAAAAKETQERSFGTFFSQFFWRAATFVLASALVVMSLVASHSYNYNKEITLTALQAETERELGELIGPTFLDFVDNPKTLKFSLRCPDDSAPAHGLLCVDEESNKAFVYVLTLPKHEDSYVLHAALEDGSEIELASFASDHAVVGLNFALNATTTAMLGTAKFRVSDSTGNVVLESV